MPDQLLTAEEVAKMLGFNIDYVWKLARNRELDVVIVGRKIRRFTPDAVKKFIDNHTLPAKED